MGGLQVLYGGQSLSGSGQPSANTINFTAQAQYVINNASCIFFSLWLPNVLPADVEKYSVALYTQSQVAADVFSLDATTAYNTTFCNGVTCNATAGTWVKTFNLFPNNDYWLVSSYSWSVDLSSNQKIGIVAQAFDAGALPAFLLSGATLP